jgi:Flp pilus assembly pilin Flp
MTRVGAFAAAFRRKLTCEAGQGLAEYALILVLIAAVCVIALGQLGIAVRDSEGFVTLPGAL